MRCAKCGKWTDVLWHKETIKNLEVGTTELAPYGVCEDCLKKQITKRDLEESLKRADKELKEYGKKVREGAERI